MEAPQMTASRRAARRHPLTAMGRTRHRNRRAGGNRVDGDEEEEFDVSDAQHAGDASPDRQAHWHEPQACRSLVLRSKLVSRPGARVSVELGWEPPVGSVQR